MATHRCLLYFIAETDRYLPQQNSFVCVSFSVAFCRSLFASLSTSSLNFSSFFPVHSCNSVRFITNFQTENLRLSGLAAFSLQCQSFFPFLFSVSRCPLLLLSHHYNSTLTLSFFPHHPSFPQSSPTFLPFFWSSLKILTSFPLLLLISQISASVTPTQRTADVRSSCVRVRLYPSESVSGGIHFTHVLLQFRLSLIHIHQCNSAFPEIWKV